MICLIAYIDFIYKGGLRCIKLYCCLNYHSLSACSHGFSVNPLFPPAEPDKKIKDYGNWNQKRMIRYIFTSGKRLDNTMIALVLSRRWLEALICRIPFFISRKVKNNYLNVRLKISKGLYQNVIKHLILSNTPFLMITLSFSLNLIQS
jgi:hypothetical protein